MSETIVLIHSVGQDGWETVADSALEWSVAQATATAVPH
jgi:hypothetical protein